MGKCQGCNWWVHLPGVMTKGICCQDVTVKDHYDSCKLWEPRLPEDPTPPSDETENQ